MAFFDKLSFSKSWILSKYSKYIALNENESTWKTLTSNECGTAINLSITPTNFLVINCENDFQEFINLWNGKDNFKGIYKGNSLLVIHKMKDFLRKFRVQFLDYNGKSGEENCESCIKELSRFIEIVLYEKSDQNSTATTTTAAGAACVGVAHQKQTSIRQVSNRNIAETCMTTGGQMIFNLTDLSLQTQSSTIDGNNLSFRSDRFLLPPAAQPDLSLNQSKNDPNNSKLSLKQMTQLLLNKNEHKLPLFYQQQNESYQDGKDDDDKALQEFIVSCLLDPKFPQFVVKVESLLTNIINSEMNNS